MPRTAQAPGGDAVGAPLLALYRHRAQRSQHGGSRPAPRGHRQRRRWPHRRGPKTAGCCWRLPPATWTQSTCRSVWRGCRRTATSWSTRWAVPGLAQRLGQGLGQSLSPCQPCRQYFMMTVDPPFSAGWIQPCRFCQPSSVDCHFLVVTRCVCRTPAAACPRRPRPARWMTCERRSTCCSVRCRRCRQTPPPWRTARPCWPER